MRMDRAVLFCLPVFLISLAGCATTSTNNDLEMQSLRNQITVLETQLKAKDTEIEDLKKAAETQPVYQAGEQGDAREAAVKKECPYPKDRVPVKVRKIQSALKKAGFNPGKIDGQMGKDTREALKAFQKANNLEVTGKVDQETWKLLKPYSKKNNK